MDKTLKSKDKLKPSWLTRHDYVRDFISKQTSFSIKKPNKYDTVMELHLGKQNANKKILYWAADPKSFNSITVKNAKDAYNKFHNNGIAKAIQMVMFVFIFYALNYIKLLLLVLLNHKHILDIYILYMLTMINHRGCLKYILKLLSAKSNIII